MAYKCVEVTIDELDQKVKEYEYALLHMISEQRFCRIGELPETDWEECIEARFFSERGELHVFDAEGERKAVAIEDDGDNFVFEKVYRLDGKYSKLGKHIVVQEYLDYDEDGQLAVELTRLKAVRQEARNGSEF